MSKPTESSWQALKRLCRYLVGLPRMIFHYRWQQVDHIDVYTDTDWAGCPRTRKSTSGGCVLLGAHRANSWFSTQSSVALSSGEAEFNGEVRGAGVGLGYQSLLRDLGIQVGLRIWTDSPGAIGICWRQGLGKLRHLDTHTLWIQQAVRSQRIDLRKVPGEVNPADLFTEHSLSGERLMKLTNLFESEYRSGQAASAPKTRSTSGTRTTLAEEMATVAEEHDDPIMPQKTHEQAELDNKHPSIEAVDEEPEDEQPGDVLYGEDLKVADKIVPATMQFGRRRVEKLRNSEDGNHRVRGRSGQRRKSVPADAGNALRRRTAATERVAAITLAGSGKPERAVTPPQSAIGNVDRARHGRDTGMGIANVWPS